MLPAFLFFASIVLFISGMTIMRKGLNIISGEKLKILLLKWTSNPVKGLIFGLIITIIFQSSSAVMITTIGLISVQSMTFRQSIGIILGTNIGTTVTLEFLAFGAEQFIFPLLIAGSLCLLFLKGNWQHLGLFFYGLGAIFLALYGFEQLAGPLSKTRLAGLLFLEMNHSLFISVLTGVFITAIIQSSTAMTGIAMGLIEGKVLSLYSAIGVMLGSNIGTCADAFLASIGGGKEARLTAYAHIWLNAAGVILFIPFLHPFTNLVAGLSFSLDQQLAHASVLFNTIVSFIFLPFTKLFAAFIEKMHG